MVEDTLHGIEKPGRYIGHEVNAYRKSFEDAGVRIALAFPDVYEVGLSHLGLRLLYHLLNRMDGVMADRVYAPWFDYEARLRAVGEPLRGIESGMSLGSFDCVGFSLQYELSYTNILTILDLGRIPLLSRERGSDDPWVIGGGPCAYNPEPLADFFDFFVLGEAEQVLPEIVGALQEWKSSSRSRREFLDRVRRIEGVYVPSFFDIAYHSDGRVAGIEPCYAEYGKVGKRLVVDLDVDAPIPETPLVPLLDIVHNRLSLEIARGCTRGCRFCQAGFIYRPVRERDPAIVLRKAQAALAWSGFEELSLLSFSTGDYCHIQSLMAALMDRFAPERVAVSFPSMRVGTLTPELMEMVRRVRKTGFTLAPEAGSERLRRVINKGILDEDLLRTAESAFGLGWRLLKLYFMTGLPAEREEDLNALVDLCLEVWKRAKPTRSSINISITTFVPKPMTPFQWAPQAAGELVTQRLDDLRLRLKKPGLRLKWHHPGHSLLEAVFARGDRRLGPVLLRAWELGVRFDGWTEYFKMDLWARAFQEAGLDPGFYALRERALDEVLPWDHLSSGVEKEYLEREYRRALAGEVTPDCRSGQCGACGVCDHDVVKPILGDKGTVPELAWEEAKPESPAPGGEYMYWLQYSRMGNIRFFGQLEIAQSLSRAIRRSGLPACFSGGFHPHVKLSFDEALPLGVESLMEEAYLSLVREVDAQKVRDLLNEHLPRGLKIEQVGRIGKRLSRSEYRRVIYRVFDLLPLRVRSIVPNWSQRLDELLIKKTKKGQLQRRLGEVLLDLRQVDETTVEMELLEKAQVCFRPALIMAQLLGEPMESFAQNRILKVAHGPWNPSEAGDSLHTNT